MGCDIHLYVEKYNEAKKVWEFIEPPSGWDKFAEENGYTPNWYQGRNYNLFAILADVRNGVGFAGVDTGDSLETIAPPKGTPKDASEDYKAIFEDWGEDGHSHSFLTVREILDFPGWEKGGTYRGWVNMEGYEHYLTHGQPEAWCGGISGGKVKHVSNEKMGEMADSKLAGVLDIQNYYTQIEWTRGYKDSCPFFVQTIMPKLVELAGSDPSSVRINFFFDN